MAAASHDAGRAADPEALIREARRRQRRRRLAVTAAVAVAAGVVSAGVAVFGTGTGRPSPPARSAHARHPAARQPDVPPIPRSVGSMVLIWTYQNATWLEQPGTGRLHHSWRPDLAAGDYQPAMIPVGRWLVYVGDGASAIRDDLSGRPRELWTRAGGQTPFFAPAAQRGHVWLVFNEQLRRHRPERARLVSVPAGRPGPAVTVPPGYRLVSGTNRGLLITGTHGGLALWNPGRAPRPVPHSRNDGGTLGFAATPRLVAYGTRCRQPAAAHWYTDQCGVLRVYNVVTGRLASIPAPSGTAGWAPYEFNRVLPVAPGDTMLAATAVPATDARHGRLYVVRLNSARPRLIPVPHAAGFLLSCLTWSPRGSWLFYPGPGSRLWAFQATTGKARSSTLPDCPWNGIMLAYPSPAKAR